MRQVSWKVTFSTFCHLKKSQIRSIKTNTKDWNWSVPAAPWKTCELQMSCDVTGFCSLQLTTAALSPLGKTGNDWTSLFPVQTGNRDVSWQSPSPSRPPSGSTSAAFASSSLYSSSSCCCHWINISNFPSGRCQMWESSAAQEIKT